MDDKVKADSLVGSFNHAIEGFIYVLKTQRNMRIHFLVAVFVVLLGIYLNFTGIEILILCIAITLVLLSEMVNTAVEATVDLISTHLHPLARVAKDVTAGAVLVASVNAIIVGYLLFTKYLPFSIENTLIGLKQSPWHITFISLIVVLSVAVMMKALFHKGTPLRGGMPSGHAALAFAMWTIISLLSGSGLVTILALIMAFLIARSRVVQGIHSLWEVSAGALVGSLATLLVFQLLR